MGNGNNDIEREVKQIRQEVDRLKEQVSRMFQILHERLLNVENNLSPHRMY